MSSEEDLELRDLVTQALESNGVLSKIRAELRASVFLALEEQDLLHSENSYASKSFRSFIKTSEGIFLTQLVREFLEFFQLDFTLSVFDPETNLGKDYEYLGRNNLLKCLGIKNMNGENEPLMAQFFKACKQNDSGREANRPNREVGIKEFDKSTNVNTMSPDDKVMHRNAKNTQSIYSDNTQKDVLDDSSKVEESPNDTYVLSSPMNEDKVEEISVGTATKKESSSRLNFENSESSKKKSITPASASGSDSTANNDTINLTSLSNLPPLSSDNKFKVDSLAPLTPGKKDISKLKTMINSLDVSDSNYEEDFLSSASGSALEGRSAKNSLPGSDSEEIEEDIGSGIDDLLSNASGLEDMTVDVTVSNVSGIADYMESV